MTSGAPWSVKGIDPKAREVAKDLARRSGMTLGEWLNQMIFEEDGPEDISSESFFTSPESGLRGPVRTYYESARQEPPARSGPTEASPSRFEAPEHPADEISRVTHALDRLVDRIESSEGRTGLAISGVEHSVREAAARIESAEREQVAIAARFENAVNETRDVQEQIANRLKRVEAEAAGPKSAEALRALESALGKVANHLYEGEARTRRTIESLRDRLDHVEAGEGSASAEAIEQVVSKIGERLVEAEARTTTALEGLKSSFSGLDERMGSLEGGGSPAIDQRLERLASSLTERVEAVRNELARNLQASTEGRFDRMERKLSEMTDQVRAAEQKSAQAIERLGREVTSVADTLSRRVIAAEQKSSDTLGQVTTEVGRITQAMESRFARNDTVHADAMERLGAEINRISERLAERIGSAERRSAQAIDEVSGQLSRVTEKIGQRAVGEDLAETLRHTEDRTARLLAETKEKIDQSLAENQRQIAETLATSPAGGGYDDRGDPFGDPEPFPSVAQPGSTTKPGAYSTKSGFATPSPLLRTPKEPSLSAQDPAHIGVKPNDHFDPADFEAINNFTPSSGARFPGDGDGEDLLPDFASEDSRAQEGAASRFESVAFNDPDGHLPPPVMPDLSRAADRRPSAEPAAMADPGRPLTTREVIEQARAAARAAGEAEAQAKAKKGARGGSILARLNRPKRQAGSSLQTALIIAGASAALTLSAAGFVLMDGQPGGGTPDRVARAIAALKTDSSKEIASSEVDTAPAPKDPRVAVAIASPDAGAAATPALDTTDLADRFSKAADAVESKKPGALDELKLIATQGYAPAQFYLAKMYETGDGGLKKDPVAARQWTSRAAENGDRRAMHNLGIAFIEGVGGPKNAVTAAQWFRRAAELGLVDSQYNLAALYERGLGVSQNAAEAYRWYLIAAKTGDEAAHKRAEQVRGQLNPDARIVAERAAAAFRPSAPNPAAAPAVTAGLGTDAAGAATVQKALSRLGYYQGPTDGSTSPALNLALAAYQRDQNLTPTGVLDQATVARLSVFTH